MSDQVNISFNFDNLIKEFENMGKDIEKIERRTTLKASKVVADKLQDNVVRSDVEKEDYIHMKDNVKISGLKKDDELNKTRSIHFGKLQYKAKWREFGTSKQDPDYLLSRTVKETEDEVKQITDNDIKKALGM
ncbi:HK97-gp10 family putative phage morphogenesis protein [Vallitalea guaymasensis]|uniref:HK97 gp10 family phage protein n=1 Tax=Vallitalea guaymasensis TaxID=1185412 RepID=A0A8J8M8C9_9FIRM|nr:HK97-gp10 family putative phage morphogenesis protein [Vallitalea guaymasensis]QUH28227.1 HK97 gp10 family phage protein [Vallitalea guaymasensis]